MATQKKIQVVKELNEKLTRAKSVVLTDYRGLTHKQLEEFRKVLKKVDGEYLVAKNTLLKRAGNFGGEIEEHLKNPTAVLFSYRDEIAPLKELLKTVKKLRLPLIKAGLLESRILNVQEVETLARLPAKEVLLAQTAGALKSPIYGLHYTLNYNLQRLMYILSNIRK